MDTVPLVSADWGRRGHLRKSGLPLRNFNSLCLWSEEFPDIRSDPRRAFRVLPDSEAVLIDWMPGLIVFCDNPAMEHLGCSFFFCFGWFARFWKRWRGITRGASPEDPAV